MVASRATTVVAVGAAVEPAPVPRVGAAPVAPPPLVVSAMPASTPPSTPPAASRCAEEMGDRPVSPAGMLAAGLVGGGWASVVLVLGLVVVVSAGGGVSPVVTWNDALEVETEPPSVTTAITG